MTNNPCKACGFSPDAKTKELAHFVLNTELVSGNQLGANKKGRSGWSYKNNKERYKRALNIIQFPAEHAKPGERRRITITRLMASRQRKFDKDNLVWGCKPIIDILKNRGWIFDDNPKHVEVVYKQKNTSEKAGAIEIKIESFT